MLPLKKHIIAFVETIINIGVGPGRDENEKTKIINAINFGSLLNQVIGVITFIYIGSFEYAFACCYIILGILLFYYFNYKKKYLLAKVYVYIYYDFVIFFASIYFSHPYLKYYYLPVLIAISISIGVKELKWLIFCTTFTFCFLLIEFTSLSHYIPRLNIDKAPASNDFIILLTLVIHILYLSIIYNLFNQSKAQLLITSYHGINEATKKLKLQRQDMISFAEASNKYLQSPIFVFNTFISKIEKGVIEQKNFEELDSYFRIIQEAINNEEMFINDMFDLNKLITSNPEYKTIFVQDFLLDLSFEFNLCNNKKMIFIIDAGDLYVYSDEKILKTIIFEIFKNALQYNLNEPKLKIKIAKSKSAISLIFADNGIGIDPAYQNKIFESFIRINQITDVKGSGLGLTKAKRGARIINARLTLIHSNQQGSTFALKFKKLKNYEKN